MAARGAKAKKEVANKILETFSGSFLYDNDKEIRIPMVENGENIQIKINLVCAKTNVDNGGDTAIPGASAAAQESAFPPPLEKPQPQPAAEPTEEEKENIEKLLKSLGLA